MSRIMTVAEHAIVMTCNSECSEQSLAKYIADCIQSNVEYYDAHYMNEQWVLDCIEQYKGGER